MVSIRRAASFSLPLLVLISHEEGQFGNPLELGGNQLLGFPKAFTQVQSWGSENAEGKEETVMFPHPSMHCVLLQPTHSACAQTHTGTLWKNLKPLHMYMPAFTLPWKSHTRTHTHTHTHACTSTTHTIHMSAFIPAPTPILSTSPNTSQLISNTLTCGSIYFCKC